MCGICGFLSKQDIRLEQLKKMNDTMYHRGPNDSGEEIYSLANGYGLGLAQRRLSILDLSHLGHQPMHSSNQQISVVFNGEIYNFLELREELRDYSFLSNCDTEVLIAAYLKWGISFVNKIKGMFAIALYDKKTEQFFLIRDRIGKKPLYYFYDKGDLVFASELKPIMESGCCEREIRRDILPQYMNQKYINAPNTIFKNVYKLEPGAVLTYHQGTIQIEKFWDSKQVYHKQKENPVASYEDAKDGLKKCLQESVRKRMIADVELGSFLSGGYDSSLITAMAQESSTEPVKTYSIGFTQDTYNEAHYAKEIAAYLGTKHTEEYIEESQMLGLVESIPKYYDEPFADSSQIPTMLVSQLASKEVTVALSGDGGDEFFCGYQIYEAVQKAQKLEPFGNLLYNVMNLPGIRKAELLNKLPFKIRAIANNQALETKTQFGADNYQTIISKLLPQGGINTKFPIETAYQEKDWQIRRMLLDIDTYLPGDILCKVDRASMKYSLETRCPILDVDVIEYAYRIPQKFKYYQGDKKHILKDITYDYIPRELLERPKTGFSVPLDQWLRGALKPALLDYSAEHFLVKQDIFDAKATKSFVETYLKTGDRGAGTGENYSRLVWAFFVFQQWYQQYSKP